MSPAPIPTAPWRVASVEAIDEMRLHVTFVYGTAGEVLLRELLHSPRAAGTVFEALREPDVFRQACVELGAVVWPNGADLAPDAMYDAIRAEGRWIVEA